ncbi:MAG TPA: sigma-70 family RNA polymerase sigma factor [Gemmatimonadaceae bacterium]|nr:sigma-70 family RNA polymerase sigma factor [Gemmatimonadaceae bacterium]
MLESELIERVRAGDMAAARQLYDAHVGAMHRLAMRMTGDESLADDATQVAFIRAFRSLDRFRGEASLGTWLHQITISASLNLIRGRKRWNAHRVELDAADEVIGHGPEPDVVLRERLHAAIDALPESYRIVFVLHVLEGFNHQEIGERLGIPTGTSKARLSVARSKLRDALHEFEGEWIGA